MSMNDTVADMLTRIRNANSVGKEIVRLSSSKLKHRIAKVLLDEGYIEDLQIIAEKESKLILVIKLKYYNGIPVIEMLSRVSKPGLRIYSSSKDLPKVKNGLGVAIVSTTKGVMTDHKARANNLGGEILCLVS